MNYKTSIILIVLIGLLFIGTSVHAQSVFVFTKTLRKGNFGAEVKKLQEILATMSDIYPEKLITGYFGNLTKQSVQKFQLKYGIALSGDENATGYGLVGPKTRKKLNELSGITLKPLASAMPSTTTRPSTSARKPNPALCPDNIWDVAEQADPTLCPEDNPAVNPNVKVSTAPINFQPGAPTSTPVNSPPVSTSTPNGIPTQSSTTQPTLTPAPSITWTKDAGIRLTGAIVPYAYKLTDGRYRMYYCGTTGNIQSAISSDGLAFEVEPGVRLSPLYSGNEVIICDPTVVQLVDGRFRLYYKGANKGGIPAIHKIYSAISSDGLNFEREGLVIDSETSGDNGWASVPEVIKLSDGRIRLYYVSAEGLRGFVSAISTDGRNFTKEEAKIYDYVDPSITKLSDGRFLFVVADFTPQGGTQLFSFVSEDGIHVDNAHPQSVIVESVADPTIVKIRENTFRIYYWKIPDSVPTIYSITGTLIK